VLRLERATSPERDTIYRLMSETWEDTYSAYFSERNILEARRLWLDALPLESALDDPSVFFELARDEGDTLVGFIAARLLSSKDLYVLRLYVHPAHQRLGVGSTLMFAALSAFPQVPAIRLDVEEGNRKGMAFWKKHGFLEIGRKQLEVAGIVIVLIEMEKRHA
jgi:ribosomal protein S18 acetylase RimI-like enzyme